MSNFNSGANNFGFNGDALVGGKLTKKYIKFVKENPNAPLPTGKIYNQNTRRIVNRSSYYTKEGELRQKYKDIGYVGSKQTIKIKKIIKTTSLNLTFPKNSLGEGILNDRVMFKELLQLYLYQLNNKLIRVVFTLNPNETREVSFTIINGKITKTIKEYVMEDYDGVGFFNGANIRGGSIRIYIYTPIKATHKQQKFLDGLDYNCVLRPIYNYFKGLVDKAETQGTKKKYQTIINKLMGKVLKSGKIKVGLVEKYKEGFTIEALQELVKEFCIDIKIYSPFELYTISQKEKATLRLDPFIEVKQTTKSYADKIFTYVNSRLDHLSELVCDQNPIEILDNLDSIKEDCINNNEYYQYQINRNKTIVALQTSNLNYKIIDNSREIIEEFEKANNLQNCFIYTNDKYNDYILDGVHYNGCIDLKEKKGFCNHIDMEKAYYNFKKNPLYDGFLYLPTNYSNKITKEFALNNVGYYKINDLDYTNCSNNDKQILDYIRYNDNCVYPHVDLMLLTEMKVDYKVIEGFFGDKFDLDFGEDMKMKFKDGKEDEEGVGLYSSWTGQQNSTSLTSRHYIKKDLEFLQVIRYEAEKIGKSANIFVNEEQEEAIIQYEKPFKRHRSHITGYITSYQRTATILQMRKFDINNIIRVCVDGIYFNGEMPELVSSFREQNQTIKMNVGGNEYIPFRNSREELYINEDVKITKFSNSKIYLGAGGTGKTTLNLRNKGLVKLGYIAHSWKLCRRMKKEYPDLFVYPVARLTNDNPQFIKATCFNCNTLLLDEAGTYSLKTIQKIKKAFKGRQLIFCGDLTHQVKPVLNDTDEDYDLETILNEFEEKITLTKNYRFQNCDKQSFMCKTIRDMMDNNYNIDELLNYCIWGYGCITRKEMLKRVKLNDVILSSRNITKDEITEKVGKVLKPKWYITKGNGEYSKGDVLYEEPINLPKSAYELRYCYTIHSIQGETLNKEHLYIDTNLLYDKRVLYTAISRAMYANNITFIK